ncbi:MAG: hypothetical protein KY467_14350, partial [Gemmatimonadetes bacterium]|nr:hypothetical protein [Gemmatimonadota bacterium]
TPGDDLVIFSPDLVAFSAGYTGTIAILLPDPLKLLPSAPDPPSDPHPPAPIRTRSGPIASDPLLMPVSARTFFSGGRYPTA